MSTLYTSDAQGQSGSLVFPLTATTILVSNPLQMPFTNGKTKILASVVLIPPGQAVFLSLTVTRNPGVEDLVVGQVILVGGTGGVQAPIFLGCVDVIPDNRPVNYALIVNCSLIAGINCTAQNGFLDVTLLSG